MFPGQCYQSSEMACVVLLGSYSNSSLPNAGVKLDAYQPRQASGNTSEESNLVEQKGKTLTQKLSEYQLNKTEYLS